MLKSVAVVIGSYLLLVVLVVATDGLLSQVFPGDFVKGKIPSSTALITSTAFFVVGSILCAWLCARLAPHSHFRHALWFFGIGAVMGVITTIPNWNTGYPHWYWLAWLLTWPVSCWIGWLLSGHRSNQPAAQVR